MAGLGPARRLAGRVLAPRPGRALALLPAYWLKVDGGAIVALALLLLKTFGFGTQNRLRRPTIGTSSVGQLAESDRHRGRYRDTTIAHTARHRRSHTQPYADAAASGMADVRGQRPARRLSRGAAGRGRDRRAAASRHDPGHGPGHPLGGWCLAPRGGPAVLAPHQSRAGAPVRRPRTAVGLAVTIRPPSAATARLIDPRAGDRPGGVRRAQRYPAGLGAQRHPA